jgi:hypothetical protein
MESGKTIALAGIIATAAVGIAGAGSSWLISRDDRNNQRALAHEARVYDRRADTYVDALALLLRMDTGLGDGDSVEQLERLVGNTDVLEARVRAYASRDAYKAFVAATNAAFLAAAAKGSDELGKRWDHASEHFSTVVHAEVG